MFSREFLRLFYLAVKTLRKGIVVSDLHLLSWRSEGSALFEARIRPQLSEMDALVLNGDSFDFRWACRPHSETIPEALAWIGRLRAEFPVLEIFYVLGNHDCLVEFADKLKSIPRISVHPHWLEIDRNLFIHGDAANYPMDLKGFHKFRKAWEDDKPKTPVDAKYYDLTDKLHLSYLTHVIWFAGNVSIKRISRHLNQVMPGWNKDMDQCFFGHTHVPFAVRELGGVHFTNTGSGIRGMDFAPAEFQYQSTEETIND